MTGVLIAVVIYVAALVVMSRTGGSDVVDSTPMRMFVGFLCGVLGAMVEQVWKGRPR